MTDMQFGLLLTVLGGGLTMITLGLIVILISLLVKFQAKS